MTSSRTPVVVALMGLPGAGKTTLAQALAPRIPARVVSRDDIRAAMFRPCSLTAREKAAAFEGVLAAIAANSELGESTIVDGMPFSREGELEAVAEAARRGGCNTLPVLCRVTVDEARRRLEHGASGGAPDRDSGLVEEVAGRLRPLPEGGLELDATRPVGEQVEAVLGAIGRPPG